MFLRKKDYLGKSKENVEILTGLSDYDRQTAEKRAVEEVSLYIRHRYDITKIFINILNYSELTAFAIGDLIEYTEPLYSSLVNYAIGDRATYNGNIYQANDITTGSFAPAKWDLICPNEGLFTCIADSTGFTPDDTDYFAENDTRNPKIVELVLDISFYRLFSAFNSRTTPTAVKENYNGNGNALYSGSAIDTLKKINKGDLTIDLPIVETEQGQNISFGSNAKRDNTY